MAKKALDELLNKQTLVELELVEIMTNPLRTLKDGVKFIPTLKCGHEQLSGILLGRNRIESFLIKVKDQ